VAELGTRSTGHHAATPHLFLAAKLPAGCDHLYCCEGGCQAAPNVPNRVVPVRVPAVPPPRGAPQARHVVGMHRRCTVRSTRNRQSIPRIPSGTVGNFCISTVSPQRGTMYSRKTVKATVELHAKTLYSPSHFIRRMRKWFFGEHAITRVQRRFLTYGFLQLGRGPLYHFFVEVDALWLMGSARNRCPLSGIMKEAQIIS